MSTPEPESTPSLNPTTGGVIAGLGLIVLIAFVITGQPLALAVGAVLSFLVIATAALYLIDRDEIVADATIPEVMIQSAPTPAKLPSKLTPACPRCKSKIVSTNKFCPECGRKLSAADFAPPSP